MKSWARCAGITALAATVGLLSCRRSKESGHEKPSVESKSQTNTQGDAMVSASAEIRCERQPFASSIDLAEASGATYLAGGDLLLVGDSGTHGAFVILNPERGDLLRRGNLKLDAEASDDLEGVSRMGQSIFAITSSGWMREWTQEGDDFIPAGPGYTLAPYDARELVCKSPRATNCAKNYEGLCLQRQAPPQGECAGFAAAKATGELLCLVQDPEGKLQLDPARSFKVAAAGSLSGCDFDDEGRLWFGRNFFAANRVGFVTDWQVPEKAHITRVGIVGFGFAEAIALGANGQMLRVSDTSASPSLLSKYICR